MTEKKFSILKLKQLIRQETARAKKFQSKMVADGIKLDALENEIRGMTKNVFDLKALPTLSKFIGRFFKWKEVSLCIGSPGRITRTTYLNVIGVCNQSFMCVSFSKTEITQFVRINLEMIRKTLGLEISKAEYIQAYKRIVGGTMAEIERQANLNREGRCDEKKKSKPGKKKISGKKNK